MPNGLSTVWSKQALDKISWWLDLNLSPIGSEATIVPTVPQLMPGNIFSIFVFLSYKCVVENSVLSICNDWIFFKKNSFIFNFLFHNSNDKFDRKIIVSNQIESWLKHICCTWVWKRICSQRGSNSRPRAWCSVPMIRAKCDTTQLFRRPCDDSILIVDVYVLVVKVKWSACSPYTSTIRVRILLKSTVIIV